MANANLNLVTTSNTFSDWLNLTDNEANSLNELRNGNYYKDNGNFTVANGSILIITPSGTTLSVTANASIAGYLTAGNLSITQNLVVTGGANVANLNATGTINAAGNLVVGNISTPKNTSTGNLAVSQNTSTGNLTVTQNIASGNLSVTAQANITTLNASNFGSYANGTIVVSGVANLNWNNSATVNVSITSNGTQTNVALSTNVAAIANLTAGGANTNIQFNDSQALQGSPNVIYNKANGQMVVNNETIVANLTFATGANATQPTLASTREVLTNAATINSPNTYTLNIANTNNFDITLGNTQFNSCNLTFNNWASTGNLQTVTVILRQPGPNGNTSQTSSNVVTWTNANVLWSNGEVPVLAGFKGKADILTFVTVDGGAHILGAHSMANIG